MENEDITIAYKNWQQAINVFNNAVTKEDIDYAIYNLEAKRRQYVRLLALEKKQEKDENDFSS